MNSINRYNSDLAAKIGQGYGTAVQDPPTTPNGDAAVDAQKAAWAQFERVLVRRESSVQSEGPEAAAAEAAQQAFQDQFGALASDKAKFHALMKEVYGDGYDANAAEALRQKALNGDFSWLPKIEFQSDAELQGGNGAYDSANNVVYINEKYLNDPKRAAQVYSEEVGAYLDTQLNASDTIGDEGEMFRKLLAGTELTDAEKAAIRADDDHATITVDGKTVEVEFSFWDDIGDAVSGAVDAVGGAISDAVDAVGGAISDAASAVGGAISDAAGAVGNFFKNGFDSLWEGIKGAGGMIWDGLKTGFGWLKDGASAVWDAAKWTGEKIADGAKYAWKGIKKAAEWFGPRAWDAIRGLGTGIWDTAVGIGKNLWESAKTMGTGIGQIFTGDFGEGFKNLGKGLLKIPQTVGDAVLMLGGRAISAIQVLVGLEPVGRKLTDAEIAELKKVYGDSIDYSAVRVKEGDAGLLGLGGRPFTHGNTIYIPEDSLPVTDELLVHEMGHVWQHQNGGTDYMGEALWAQNVGDGYDWEKGVGEGKSWSELNPEQQSELLEDAYKAGFFDGTGKRFVVGGVDYTDYLNDALGQVRRGEGAT